MWVLEVQFRSLSLHSKHFPGTTWIVKGDSFYTWSCIFLAPFFPSGLLFLPPFPFWFFFPFLIFLWITLSYGNEVGTKYCPRASCYFDRYKHFMQHLGEPEQTILWNTVEQVWWHTPVTPALGGRSRMFRGSVFLHTDHAWGHLWTYGSCLIKKKTLQTSQTATKPSLWEISHTLHQQ